MANPNGNLSGFTDPEEEGWQDRIVGRVRQQKSQTKSKRHQRREGEMKVYYDLEFRAMLMEAAQKRGISVSGYMRRSIAAFVASDLGIPFEEATQYLSKPVPYGEVFPAPGTRVRSKDDGTGFGDWSVR